MNQIVKITAYDEFREKVGEVQEICNFIPDVASDDGYAKSKRVALDVGKLLTAIEKKRKELKQESLDYGRKVDSEAKAITTELEEFQLPHKNAYKELDKLKKEREAERKQKLEDRVVFIRNLPDSMRDMDSGAVKQALEDLNNEECLDFYEYTEQALKARNSSRSELGDMFASKLKTEAEAVELEKLRKEAEERKQKEYEENLKKEAAAKAEKEAQAAKEAEQKAIEQAAEAVRQREAAEAKAKQDAIEAEERAKKQAAEAAERAKQEEIARQEAERKAQEDELAKREANKKHIGKIRKEAKEGLMALGLSDVLAQDIVMAIHNGKIKNVSIAY